MTDFFTMPGGVVNLQSEDGIANLGGTERSSMAYVQPPGNTKDDGGTVRFNTIDWERRAKVAADGAAGLRAVVATLPLIASSNYFGDMVEGQEVYRRLTSLLDTWSNRLVNQAKKLDTLAAQCNSAGASLSGEDRSAAAIIQA